MDEAQKGRLERYLRNAYRFLWDLGPGNQRENYAWLERKGFRFERKPYSDVTDQLIKHPGIEAIVRELVVPVVKERFGENTLEVLRYHWRRGILPSASELAKLQVNMSDMSQMYRDEAVAWRPFVEWNAQYMRGATHRYTERWGELAGIWFEEIEGPYRA